MNIDDLDTLMNTRNPEGQPQVIGSIASTGEAYVTYSNDGPRPAESISGDDITTYPTAGEAVAAFWEMFQREVQPGVTVWWRSRPDIIQEHARDGIRVRARFVASKIEEPEPEPVGLETLVTYDDGPRGIGWAIEQMRAGKCVRRPGWNGKGMFLYLVPGSRFKVNRPPLLGIYEHGKEINYLPHVDMKTATGECVPWLCDQGSLLANDWEVAE